MASNSCIIHDCGRLIANSVINAFKEGAWEHNVELSVDKTTPGWFSTSIDIRFKWTGDQSNVDSYTIAAKNYIDAIST